MLTTENLFKEFLDEVEKKIRTEFIRHMPEATCKYLVKRVVEIIEKEARERMAIGTLPPHDFPVGMMHQDDYYGLDNEELSKKLQAASLGCDWDI